MSGHSKWHKIRSQKGAADAKRGALFTQLARAVTVAAREKGGDPAMNFQLKAAIEKAKAANVPKDNIERAIKKGTGEIESEVIEEILYEGYAPGGAAVLVESLSDNRNRTASDIKHLFSKHGGNLGGPGSVAWMFERKGVIFIANEALEGKDLDEVELEMIDAGAEDVKREDEGLVIVTAMGDLQSVQEKVEAAGFKAESADLEYVPKDPVAYDAAQHGKLEKFIDTLEENQDVKATYSNISL